MLRYAITDATHAAADFATAREALRSALRRWIAEGLDFVQVREKGLPSGELFDLVEMLAGELRQSGGQARLLVNSRADVAMAAGAHGVHLTAAPGELTPVQIHQLFAGAGREPPVVSVSCHSVEQVERARDGGADLILSGPVFEKVVRGTPVASGTGLELLRQGVRAAGTVPVLALGGVTISNAPLCLSAGAAGIAGIRLFGFADHRYTTE